MAGKPTIFVAYPYSFPEDDYRRPFDELGESFGVDFVFADAEITGKHILEKITRMIRDSRFSLFDITEWNPNVTLELGIAIGHRQEYYLLFSPDRGQSDAPADLGGIDRIEYESYGQLEDGLTRLLLQEFGVPQEGRQMADQLEALRDRVPVLIGNEPGLKIADIGERLGVPTEMAKLIVRPLVEDEALDTTGVKRGTRYYLPGQAPPQRRRS
jgi:hypothetical protein